MKKNRYLIIFFIVKIGIIVSACNIESHFKNEKGNCELKLYSDSTYKYVYPNFFGPIVEMGSYQINGNLIILIRKEKNDIDSTSVSYECFKSDSDTLLIKFININHEIVRPKLFVNKSSYEFISNKSGQIKLSYSDLEKRNIIPSGANIESLKVVYKGKEYYPDLRHCANYPRPDKHEIKLNQFLGEEFVLLKRKYKINSDTIYVNDFSRKTIKDKKLILQ